MNDTGQRKTNTRVEGLGSQGAEGWGSSLIKEVKTSAPRHSRSVAFCPPFTSADNFTSPRMNRPSLVPCDAPRHV